MALAVKITGGPTVWDATMTNPATVAGAGFVHVIGVVYTDDHPMKDSANTALNVNLSINDGTNGIDPADFDVPVGQPQSAVHDGTAVMPLLSGVPFDEEVAAWRIHETATYT